MGTICRSPLAAFVLAPLATYGRLSPDWQPAQQTYPGRMPILGLDPAPTPAPLDAVALPELLRRDNSQTCAYLYGHTDLGLTCDLGYTCSTNPTGSVFHCCTTGSNSCFMPTACLDYTAYLSGLCQSNGTSTTCCSDSATPYCTAVIMIDKPSVSLVGCFPTKTYVPMYANPTDASTTSSTQISTSISSSTSTTLPSPTLIPPTPTPTPEQGSTQVSVIVGGVVGGLAVIAIIVGIIAWLIIKNRKVGRYQGQSALGSGPPMAAAQYGHQSYMPPPDPRAGVAVKLPHESMHSSSAGGPAPGSDPSSPSYGGFYLQQQPQSAWQSVAGQEQAYNRPHYQPGAYMAEL